MEKITVSEKIFNWLVDAEESVDVNSMIRALGYDIEGKSMRGFNALANPGLDKIFIGRECFEKLTRKEQMAVLAHEIGHLRAPGGLPTTKKYGMMTLAGTIMLESTPAMVSVVIDGFGLLNGGKSLADSIKYDWEHNRRNLMIAAGIIGGIVIGGCVLIGVGTAKSMALHHAAEFAADEFAKSLGFGPELASALQKLCTKKIQQKQSSTHPAMNERILRLVMTAIAA